MWNFGSGSYNTDKAKEKLTGKKTTKKSKKDKDDGKVSLHHNSKPTNLEDELDDFGLDSDED